MNGGVSYAKICGRNHYRGKVVPTTIVAVAHLALWLKCEVVVVANSSWMHMAQHNAGVSTADSPTTRNMVVEVAGLLWILRIAPGILDVGLLVVASGFAVDGGVVRVVAGEC